jgi:hypothetical protein
MPIGSSLKIALTVARDGVLKPLEHGTKLDAPAPEPILYDQFNMKPQYTSTSGPLFVDGASGDDVEQGTDGDCFFMASLSAVAQTHPELIENAIKKNADGTYTVTLHEPVYGPAAHRFGWLGQKAQATLNRLIPATGTRPVQVTVDGELPNGGAFDAHSRTGELWPALMEKAYAKLWGNSYASIDGGDPVESLQTLTGGKHKGLHTAFNNDDATFDFVKKALDAKQPIVATTKSSAKVNPANGDIVGNHVYSVVGAGEENGQRYVELRNPWGFSNTSNFAPTLRISVDELRAKFSQLNTVQL